MKDEKEERDRDGRLYRFEIGCRTFVREYRKEDIRVKRQRGDDGTLMGKGVILGLFYITMEIRLT